MLVAFSSIYQSYLASFFILLLLTKCHVFEGKVYFLVYGVMPLFLIGWWLKTCLELETDKFTAQSTTLHRFVVKFDFELFFILSIFFYRTKHCSAKNRQGYYIYPSRFINWKFLLHKSFRELQNWTEQREFPS